MSKEKAARRKAAGGPMDPAQISMMMSPLPGAPPGPGNMNGNPQNIPRDPGGSTMAPDGLSENLYRDGRYAYPQMGTGMVNPMMVPRSGVGGPTPIVTRGLNAGVPYGLQQQPSPQMADMMEGMRQMQTAASKGVMANPGLGITGLQALGMPQPQMMPGAISPQVPGQGAPLMPPMTSMNPMTPGADKKVIKKTGKK